MMWDAYTTGARDVAIQRRLYARPACLRAIVPSFPGVPMIPSPARRLAGLVVAATVAVSVLTISRPALADPDGSPAGGEQVFAQQQVGTVDLTVTEWTGEPASVTVSLYDQSSGYYATGATD